MYSRYPASASEEQLGAHLAQRLYEVDQAAMARQRSPATDPRMAYGRPAPPAQPYPSTPLPPSAW